MLAAGGRTAKRPSPSSAVITDGKAIVTPRNRRWSENACAQACRRSITTDLVAEQAARYATLPNIMKALKKPLDTYPAAISAWTCNRA